MTYHSKPFLFLFYIWEKKDAHCNHVVNFWAVTLNTVVPLHNKTSECVGFLYTFQISGLCPSAFLPMGSLIKFYHKKSTQKVIEYTIILQDVTKCQRLGAAASNIPLSACSVIFHHYAKAFSPYSAESTRHNEKDLYQLVRNRLGVRQCKKPFKNLDR